MQISKSRSITFKIPGTDYHPLKCHVALDMEVESLDDVPSASKLLDRALKRELLKDVYSHLDMASGVLLAKDVDELVDYLEEEIRKEDEDGEEENEGTGKD